ncbi:predicted protein [Nematostella vectensis]|uniref:Lipoxygenase domain-containing protein n=1 Tax=Nematostella vectensis TaxID=45351 RepID=A7RS62_NEMVE|nr:predicted protein [Nematostella vectensis]|eukprot:XP_001637816.1 predicted protein [Nematostella vectensis]
MLSYIKRRGVLSKSRLPYYPYRDDGQLIHRAVQAMAGEYVDIYYKHNADVEADYELQNFANQVSADGAKEPDGGTARIKGFPPRVTSLCVLKKIITRLVWATSAAHSVANYPFNYYGLYTPSMPTKLYHDPKQTPGQFDIYNLPNKFTSVVQSALGMNLASMFYDTLFDYGKELNDARARSVVTKHSADLNGWILKTIEKRNRKRYEQNHLSYPYLVPGWIANSIHT